MRDWLIVATQYIAIIAEVAAAAVILVGALQAIWTFARKLIKGCCESHEMMRARIKLGHSLSLALEFLIGADILKTAVAPTWDEIGQLAAIIGVRTVLNFFLHRELEHELRLMRDVGKE